MIDIVKDDFFSSLKMSTMQHGRITLTAESDANEPIIKFKTDKYELEKNSENDMFYLKSVQNLLTSYNKNITDIRGFIKSNMFYQMLCFIDKSLPKYGFVYLLVDDKKKHCKIGKTFNFDKRYTKSKTVLLDRLVPVNNDKQTETELLKLFRSKYQFVEGTKETFEYTSLRAVRDDFNSIALINQAKITYKSSKHISNFYFSPSRQGLWCSFQVVDLILNFFIEDPTERDKINSMLQLINLSIDKDSYQFIQYDSKYKTNIIYMKFHKYTIIGREIDKYVNGSRLYNSIIKADQRKKKYSSFRLFMERGPMHKWVERFNEEYPDLTAYKLLENKENKYLEGYYVHPLLVHFIIEEIDTKYAFAMSKLMFKLNNPGVEIDMDQDLNTEHFKNFNTLTASLQRSIPEINCRINLVETFDDV